MLKTSEIPLKVVRRDEDLLGELLKSLAKTDATQVFVTGPAAFRTLADSVDSISTILGQTWTVLPCKYAPTQADMSSLMAEFASAIDGAPSHRHICFGPTSPERLLEYLFRASQNGFYKAGLYILGFCLPPISNLVKFGKAINTESKVPGFIESIISTEDNRLLISEQQELKALIDQGVDTCNKMWNIMTLCQDQIELEEKVLRSPIPPSGKDGLATIADVERRKRGLLPPPQNIGFNFKCECGVYLSVNLKDFDIFSGVQVKCAHCGAVCFVPPEILDHTKYDPLRKGATLRGGYQSLLRFVYHGTKS